MAQQRSESGRRRLPPEVRRTQILDAACAEFSERGFASTRIDDIAARAGLSKGGIYTHFPSKDAVLEALLGLLLNTSVLDERALTTGEVTLERVIDLLASELYTWCTREPFVATFRLLMAESVRLPGLVDQWRKQAENAYAAAIGKMVRKGVMQGHLRPGAATKNPLLLIAPITQMCVRRALISAPVNQREFARHREAYRELLRELLAPSRGNPNLGECGENRGRNMPRVMKQDFPDGACHLTLEDSAAPDKNRSWII
ncbi:TetR/AcrR family transcriptional regulator [Burkholderia seminalis]|uniref:TetR/AcrR family transcriptional regulator n=2 Tax=Burkholderia cepacia complex TaxID=87882 RepID=A0A8A8DE09_9BURK|nr:TetR/AcrR family transcriptional regulator [Burkholderia seminalis]QTO23353.1 TetR/AcrR family transcriptional regulator [Burkholderia seminalis]